ncbi:MAG: metallophosphoesterase [Chloroflexi bacterium]|nr:metallophosphoesterase [Chloroflexota bacterium]
MQPKDFSTRSSFPGTTENGFDHLLRRFQAMQNLSPILFGVLLLALAMLPYLGRWLDGFFLWIFYLVDWGLLASLPRFKKSFGPSQPSTLVLAILRLIIALLPVSIAFPLQAIGTILVIYAFWIEPHHIRLTSQALHTGKNHFNPGLRILHIGDLHVERITARERQINQIIQETHPDVILFSGDFINLSYLRDPEAWEAARAIMKDWQAPLGVYAVSGSPAVDLPDVLPSLLEGLPIRWLKNEKITLCLHDQEFDLVGVSCTHKPFIDGAYLSSLLPEKPERFTVLLYHSPDLAPQAAAAGVDLQLSGHTHGGQVRLPLFGAVFTGSLYGKRFEAGRYKVGEMTLYVTRGIGMEGMAAPRVRFLCPPEIIVWEIQG